MREEDFVFSLYPNDLIKVTVKNVLQLHLVNSESTLQPHSESKETMLYYSGADISTASISCKNHDNTYYRRGLGIKSLDMIEKFTVDVLGYYHRIEREPRMPFHQKRC